MAEMMRNRASDTEKAEGSRENVNLDEQAGKLDRTNGAENPMERGSGQPSRPGKAHKPTKTDEATREDAGGITNRPWSEERHEEDQRPARG